MDSYPSIIFFIALKVELQDSVRREMLLIFIYVSSIHTPVMTLEYVTLSKMMPLLPALWASIFSPDTHQKFSCDFWQPRHISHISFSFYIVGRFFLLFFGRDPMLGSLLFLMPVDVWNFESFGHAPIFNVNPSHTVLPKMHKGTEIR